MDGFETNIDIYSLEDMFNLYKIDGKLSDAHLIQMTETYTLINRAANSGSISPAIHLIFKKIFVIITCLHKYRSYRQIKDPTSRATKSSDEKLIVAVKNINNFEEIGDVSYLLHQVLKEDAEDTYIGPSVAASLIDRNALPPPQPLVADTTLLSSGPVINTFENKLVSGTINALKRISKLVNVHIDSCFRDKYYNSNPCNFVYMLPKQFKNVVAMKLASIEIPNAWFLFSHLKKNNTFIIETTVCSTCSVHNIVIPDGNYDKDTLTAFLNMKYFSQSHNKDSPLRHLCISINENNNKTQFEVVSGAPKDFIFSVHFTTDDTMNMMDTCGWLLGFRLARYIKIDDFLLSEGLFDAGGDRYIYLTINDYQYNYNESNVICFDKSSIEDFTLAKIPMINGKLSLIIDENNTNPLVKVRQYNGPVNINKLEIKIMDKYGNIINLNFMDFSFSLELEMLYERNNIV